MRDPAFRASVAYFGWAMLTVPFAIWLSLGLWAVVWLTAAARNFRWE